MTYSIVTEAEWTDKAICDLYLGLLKLKEIFPKIKNDIWIRNIMRCEKKLGITKDRYGCGAARTMAAVDCNGDVYPCHRFIGYFKRGVEQRIGNVETGFDPSLREFYISANHSSTHSGCGAGMFEETISEENKNCGSSLFIGICSSNCIAVNEHMSGDPRVPHYINRVHAQIEAKAFIDDL